MVEIDFSGMTVNERLGKAALFDEWDAAVRCCDRAAMIAILERVEVGNPSNTVDSFLANPAKYGF